MLRANSVQFVKRPRHRMDPMTGRHPAGQEVISDRPAGQVVTLELQAQPFCVLSPLSVSDT